MKHQKRGRKFSRVKNQREALLQSLLGGLILQEKITTTEAKAKEAGYETKIGKFPFMARGKAFAIGEREGFVKFIFDAKYGEILGVHIIGSEATEMIAEAVLGKALEATGESIFKTVHAHPTLSESIMEAAAQAYGEAIHI